MTQVEHIKTKCHVCGTDYEGPVLIFWNPLLGKKPDIGPLTCPKCKTPYRSKVEPNIGNAKDILYASLEDAGKAADWLFSFCHSIADLRKWEKLLKEINYEDWKKTDEEFAKDFPENTAELKVNREKREKL